MKSSFLCIAIACAALPSLAPTPASADDAPSAADLSAAKKAYNEGKALHDKGNLPDAIEKFKESYKLSKNPLLLYNIAFTMDEAGTKDLALTYYKKFLLDAPADAQQRPAATERVKVLEKEAPATADKPDPTATATPPKGDSKVKPAGTYTATDFQHQVVEEAPPGKPLDLSAAVPEDSGFVVTLYFRATGESNYTAKVMKPRYKELVARIPAAKMSGTAVQYYVECKDAAGTVVTRAGKATEPNLVSIEATAQPKFYPDVVDDVTPPPVQQAGGDGEDPLSGKKQVVVDQPIVNNPGEQKDAPSSGLTYAKWGTTIGSAALLGASVLFYIRAGNAAKALADDSASCGSPPCRAYDQTYDADLQSGGQRDSKIYAVTLGLGAATAVVAGYLWYREHQAKKNGDLKVGSKPSPENGGVVIAPMFDTTGVGAAAVGRF